MDPVAVGFATTGATLLITVLLFALDRAIGRRAQRQEKRRQLMARVLDTLDLASRSLARPAFVKMWTNTDLEYALLGPRLLLDLGKKDRVVAAWALRQVQLMQLESSAKRALLLRASVSAKLLQWHHGELRRSWFEGELRVNKIDPDFRVPVKVKSDRMMRDAWSWAQLLGLVVAFAFMIREVVRRET